MNSYLAHPLLILASGAFIGLLGGVIGLGGAEFRLPLLISLFGFVALEAVILNKAMSLIVVASALPFRFSVVPFETLVAHSDVIAILLSGSLIGAWSGAGWATQIKAHTLYKIIAVLLVLIAGILLFGHGHGVHAPLFEGSSLIVMGALAGVGIGIFASLLGVAGGELLIPTITLLFGLDLKLAGSLSLAVSLPTMLVGFARYSQDQSFNILKHQIHFVGLMALGSIIGTYVGSLLLGIMPTEWLLPALASILVISSVKVWQHA